MTRIIAGAAGGRRLRTPSGDGTRPSSGRVREALFSSLGDLTGLVVLDLYAGSGACGLEALSRGAAHAIFVEQAPLALAALRANIAALGLRGAQVVASDVLRFLAREPEPCDVVLADPPYAMPVEELLAAAAPWAADRMVLERATRSPQPTWPHGLEPMRRRKYGDTTLWYLRAL